MPENLVRTKLIVPPLRRDLLSRPHLVERLNQGLFPGAKLTLVSAPAGYGKTSALAQWVHSSHSPIGWLSLDASDNEFERFFRYLVLSWEEVQPGIIDGPLGKMMGALAPDQNAVLTTFINVANSVPEDTALVLNDYHLIEEPSIHHALTFLIDHLPASFHIFLATRGEPPLPFARYRARGELQELGVDDLRFSSEEASELFNDLFGLALTPDEMRSLATHLQGWIVGLQLAALALKRGLATTQLTIDGRQRFIADFLQSEVLDGLPTEIRQFLLQTSILDRLCGPLCEAITESEDGQTMLETLEREGLFLAPLDDKREWFRYHPLFADFLGAEVRRHHPEIVAELHSRAAHWFLAQGLFEPAFEHAVAGNAGPIVAEIAERRFDLMLHIGQLKLIRRWLDVLPESWQFQYPVIGLTEAYWLAFTGAVAACISQIDKVEQAILQSEREDQQLQLARVTTVRCQIACHQNNLALAEPLAERALQDLPAEDHHYRANIHHSMGEVYRHLGRWQNAREHYHKALALVDDPGYRYRSTHVYGALADVELRQGRLGDAARYWQKALSVIEARDSWGKLPLPLTGWVYVRMAEIQYEWNELQTAAELVRRGLELAELGGVVQALIVGYVLAGRLQLTWGAIDTAASYLEQARPHLENAQFHQWNDRFERLQVELWLAQDRLRTAVNWSDERLKDHASTSRPRNEMIYLGVARVLIFRGDRAALRQALTLLKQLGKAASEEGRTAVQLESLTLRALVSYKVGDEATALTEVEQALRLAEPEGYVRLFADLGLPMARLLQAAQARNVMPGYVSQLLAALGDDLVAVTDRLLPEPMTEREAEILTLIAAGLTNREIGAKLVISPETVKKHAGNIYGKLNVSSRTEAVAVARELGLLD